MKKAVRQIILSRRKLIGDLLSVRAVACYSLRRLYDNYLGFCVRVRRSSDNALQDIGFDANGILDTAALLTFVGLGNGLIAIFYDQSGNNYHAINDVSALQVSIVIGGVLQLINMAPALRSTIAQQNLLSNNPDFAQPNYINVVSNNPSYSGVAEIIFDGRSTINRNLLNYANLNRVSFFAGGTAQAVTLPSAAIPLIWGGFYSGVNSVLRINGSPLFQGDVGAASLGRIVLMADGGSPFQSEFSFTGFLSEAWVFSQNIPTANDIQLLERNQGLYYGITVG